ncbi:hypothetical protein CDV36_011199 [Fusarium kuroshium]|uniref:Uncharacterized protein n=1 Tax=Fusarium kuroshium TaxID=2010991 RepID=A0A3M2RW93_9HYPO|nr:hypothetical protein CDV36_011199 [Fusarium kuroshium]
MDIQTMEQQTLETRAMATGTVGSKRRRLDEPPTRYDDDDDCPISPPIPPFLRTFTLGMIHAALIPIHCNPIPAQT